MNHPQGGCDGGTCAVAFYVGIVKALGTMVFFSIRACSHGCNVLTASDLFLLEPVVTKNDVLRRVRYIFDFSDSKMIALFALGGIEVSREQVSDWLKKDEDPAFKTCPDRLLAAFLNGLIIDRRGKKEGAESPLEDVLSNNQVLRKLRIALDLKEADMLALMNNAETPLGKPELSALFRSPGHKHYRECKDQFLRIFLRGLQLKHRPGGDQDEGSL